MERFECPPTHDVWYAVDNAAGVVLAELAPETPPAIAPTELERAELGLQLLVLLDVTRR